MGCYFFLQGIFPTQGSNPRLLHRQAGSLPLSPQGGPFSYLPYCQSLITSTLTSLIHLELSCFLCQIGVEFLPQNFFFYIILYLKLAKKNIKNFNIALTQVSIVLLYLSVSGLSLCTHRHTQRHTHTHTHTHIILLSHLRIICIQNSPLFNNTSMCINILVYS